MQVAAPGADAGLQPGARLLFWLLDARALDQLDGCGLSIPN